MFRYCNYKCLSQADCPAQTNCQADLRFDGQSDRQRVRVQLGTERQQDLGQACTASDTCKTGQLCDGTCLSQCDGPGATCATGTCTIVNDTASGKTIGYVCK